VCYRRPTSFHRCRLNRLGAGIWVPKIWGPTLVTAGGVAPSKHARWPTNCVTVPNFDALGQTVWPYLWKSPENFNPFHLSSSCTQGHWNRDGRLPITCYPLTMCTVLSLTVFEINGDFCLKSQSFHIRPTPRRKSSPCHFVFVTVVTLKNF